MARFYASDVLYKDYARAADRRGAARRRTRSAGLGGQQLKSSQFLPAIQWLDPTHVASVLHVNAARARLRPRPSPGLHGHSLNSVSVGGTTLQTGSTNTIPASPLPRSR